MHMNALRGTENIRRATCQDYVEILMCLIGEKGSRLNLQSENDKRGSAHQS